MVLSLRCSVYLQVEFILMGGTFMSLPLDYRDYFVRNLHDALSGHSSSNVAEAVRFSEQSRTRCIGLTIETRPDYCLTPHLTQVSVCHSTAVCGEVHARHRCLLTAASPFRKQGRNMRSRLCVLLGYRAAYRAAPCTCRACMQLA